MPIRALIVDDDRDFAEGLADAFELTGHRAQVVFGGQAAIDRCLHEDFDVVLLDIQMPDLDGVKAFLEIRRLKPDARVVMMRRRKSS